MDIQQQMELRSRLATNIKRALYPDAEWPKVYMNVATFIVALCKTRSLHAGLDEREFLNKLLGYTSQDLIDAFEDLPKVEINPMFARALKL